eukprot:866611-Amphidinium_carterae.2
MLTGLMSPDWAGEMQKGAKDFAELFLRWESQVALYEMQRGRPLDADVKVAVVMRHAPGDVKQALRQASHVIGDDYNRLRDVLATYMQSGRDYNSLGVCISHQSGDSGGGGAQPMDVGGLQDKGKYGKGKGKDKGKQKGKGKPWQPGGKSKGKEKGKQDKGGKSPPGTIVGAPGQFQGYCNACGAWGHRRAQCPNRTQRVGGLEDQGGQQQQQPQQQPQQQQQAAPVQQPPQQQLQQYQQQQQSLMRSTQQRQVGHVERFYFIDDDDDEDERHYISAIHDVGTDISTMSCRGCQQQHVSMVAAADSQPPSAAEEEILVMLDSGSDEHCAPQWFGEGLEASRRQLVDVQGGWIEHHGQRHVLMEASTVESDLVELDVTFQVTSCSKPLMSLGKLWRQQQIGIQTKGGQLFIEIGGHLLPVLVLGNSLYIRVKLRERQQVAAAGALHVGTLGDEIHLAPVDWQHPEAHRDAQVDEHMEEAPRDVQVGIYDEGDPRAIAAEYGPIHLDFEGGEPGHTWASRVVDIRDRLRTLGLSTHGAKAELLQRLNHHERRLAERKSLTGFLQERHGALMEGRRPYAPIVLPVPEKPSEAEMEAHISQGHANYAAWCEHCVRGKAKDDGHFRRTIAEKSLRDPVVEFDFMYLGAAYDHTDAEGADIIILAVVDTVSQLGKLVQLPGKKVTDYVVFSVVNFIDSLGVQRVVLRSDNEEVCKLIGARVKAKRTQHTEVTYAPRYSSQSKGTVENYIQRMQGQIRTMRLELECKYGAFGCEHGILPWLVRHAASAWNWYHRKVNGRTAHEDAFNQPFGHRVVPFGETILFRAPMSHTGRLLQGTRYRKGDPVWHRGVWLGLTENSAEDIVGTEHGVLKVRSIKRLVKDEQYDRGLFGSMVGTPWAPLLGVVGRPPKRGTSTPLVIPSTPATLPATPMPSIPATPGVDPELQRALELSVQIGTPRHDLESVGAGAAGSGTSSDMRAAEVENQRQLEEVTAESMRDSEKRPAPAPAQAPVEPSTPPAPTNVPEAIAHFERLSSSPKRAKT